MWQHAFYLCSFILSFLSLVSSCCLLFVLEVAVEVVAFFLSNKTIKSWSYLFGQSSAGNTCVLTECYLACGLKPPKQTCITVNIFVCNCLLFLM